MGALRPMHPDFSIFRSPFTLLASVSANLYLVKNLVRRDLNQQYKNAVLGYVWTLLEPALLASVYYILFIIIANHSEPNYPMYVLLGVIGWGMFSRILNGTVNSLSNNSRNDKANKYPNANLLFIISHHTVCHHLSIITDCNSIHDSPRNYSNGKSMDAAALNFCTNDNIMGIWSNLRICECSIP